jgi:hypothetical protein
VRGGRSQQRERTPFEGASIVFGALIAGFGLWAAIESLADGEGPGSAAFIISVAFVLLGSGRVYLGLRPPR